MVKSFAWGGQPWLEIAESTIDRRGTGGAMLRVEEKKYLYWLMRDCYEGKGTVLDLGPLLGGSTLCLTGGALDNPSLPADRRVEVESYDLFHYDGTWGNLAHRGIHKGDDFLALFIENIANIKDHVKPVQGDILAVKTYEQPIEVLFVDLAKNETLMRHVMKVFYPKVMLGDGIVIHQDYKFVGMPYLKIYQQAFAEFFELLPFPADVPTVAYRLVKPLPVDFAGRVDAIAKLPLAERVALLKAARDQFSGSEWHIMNSSVVMYQTAEGAHAEAAASLKDPGSEGRINKTAGDFYKFALAKHPDMDALLRSIQSATG